MGKIIHNGVTITREINVRNILTVQLSSNYTIVASATYEQLSLSSYNQVGGNLSIDSDTNNTVICGKSGKMLLSGRVSFNSCATGLKWFTLYKNSAAVLAAPFNTGTDRITIAIPPTLIAVSANDTISMKIQGTAGDVVRSGAGYTEMTLEYVD